MCWGWIFKFSRGKGRNSFYRSVMIFLCNLDEKTMKFDEFLPKYVEIRNAGIDNGTPNDYLEILKLYEVPKKAGKIMFSDLNFILQNMGEEKLHFERFPG